MNPETHNRHGSSARTRRIKRSYVTDWAPRSDELRPTLRAAREPGVLHRAFAGFTLTRVVGGEAGDIALCGGGLFAVLFLFIIGDECHSDFFYKITEMYNESNEKKFHRYA
jgi:hypothetical protein